MEERRQGSEETLPRLSGFVKIQTRVAGFRLAFTIECRIDGVFMKIFEMFTVKREKEKWYEMAD